MRNHTRGVAAVVAATMGFGLNALAVDPLIAWDFAGKPGNQSSPQSGPTTVDPLLSGGAVTDLIRGGLTPKSDPNTFSASNWSTLPFPTDPTTSSGYIEFSIEVPMGHTLSLSSIAANFKRDATGPTTYYYAFSLDGFSTAFTTPPVAIVSPPGASVPQPPVDLTGLADLQNMPGGTTLYVDLFAWGASNSNGRLSIGTFAGDDYAFFGGFDGGGGPATALLDNRAPTSTPFNADYVTSAVTTTVNGPARINSLTVGSGHTVNIVPSANSDEPSPFARLQVDSGSITAIGATTSVISGGTLALQASPTFDVNSSLRVDSIINAFAGTFVKKGPGTLELTAAPAYNLPVHVQNGTILLSGSGNLGGASIELGDSVAGTPGFLDLNGRSQTFFNGTSSSHASSAIVNNSVSTSTLTAGTSGTTTLGASMQGNLAVQIGISNQTQILSGNNNTYSGGTNLNGGTLILASDHAAGSGTITTNPFADLVILANPPQSAITLPNSLELFSAGGTRTFKIDAANGKSAVFTGNLLGGGKLSRGTMPNTSQSLVAINGSASGFTGEIEIADGALGFGDASTLPNGSISLGKSDGTGVPTNAVLLTKGSITRPLSGTNAISFNNNGTSGFAARGGMLTLFFPTPDFGITPVVWGQDGFVRDGAGLMLGSTFADNVVEFDNNINLGTTSVGNTLRNIWVVDNPNSPNDYGEIAGQLTGNLGINKRGNGELRLGVHGTNFHTGGTVVSEGVLSFQFNHALGASGTPVQLAGGTLSMDAFLYEAPFLGKGKFTHDVLVNGTGHILESTSDSMGGIERAVPFDQVVFSKEGPGVLTADRVRLTEVNPPSNVVQGQLAINGGTLAIAAGHSNAQTSIISRLQLFNTPNFTGTFDLNDQDLIFKSNVTSYLDVRSWIVMARNGGSWDAAGLTSGIAKAVAADVNNPNKTALASARAFTVSTSTFNGIPVLGSDILVKYTYLGDANLDGTVGSTDFNLLLNGYGITSGAEWFQGDFDYNGKVNTIDFNWLAGNFGQTLPASLPGPSLGATVPEPAGLAMLGMVVWGQSLKRRR